MERLKTLTDVDLTSNRLFPPGKNFVPGIKAINPTDGPAAAAASAARANNPENLASFFENGNHNHGILYKSLLDNGYVVSLISPSAPYTPLGLMICAGNPKEVRMEGYSDQTIYDLPEDVQKKYWELTLATLLVYGELTDEHIRYITVATENTTPVTSKGCRTSRTLKPPHVLISKFDKNAIQEGKLVMPSLALEQRLSRNRLAGEFVDQVYLDMFSPDGFMQMGFIVPPQLRKVEPYGYAFAFAEDNILAKIDLFQQVMRYHHEVYSRQSGILEKQMNLKDYHQARIIPQPAYRTYVYFDGGLLKVIISPEFLSHAGVTEAAGVETVRSEAIKPIYTPEEIKTFKDNVLQGVQSKLK